MTAKTLCFWMIVGLLPGLALAQAPAPNPYRTVENWAKIHAGLERGQVSGV